MPASPTPFTPSGLTGDGVTVWLRLDPRHHAGTGDGVIHQLAREQLTAFVVDGVFVKRLTDTLCNASVDLTGHKQRIDDVAAVVARDVSRDVDTSPVSLSISVTAICAPKGKAKFGGSQKRVATKSGIDSGRKLQGTISGARDVCRPIRICRSCCRRTGHWPR